MPELRIFAQAADASVDIEAWNAHAVRFFATRLGFADAREQQALAEAARNRSSQASAADASRILPTRFVVAPAAMPAGIRSARRRASAAVDVVEAEEAEAVCGTSGLALLARRCGAIWVVERETREDAIALTLAAILASLVLGPILDPEARAIFGVKTARAKLQAVG